MVAAYTSGNGHGVKSLIGGLNATGHVTHTKHRKDMVTVHHNGGRLSHEGVLNVWKTRPASAHFDVDAAADVAQYVEMNEFAWACGNTEGNQRSISIEMANLATNGNWPVSEATWREAARLAGWIHAKVFGFRPTNATIVPHHHWKSTTCAGPYMNSVWGQFIQIAQQAYDFFKSGGPVPLPTNHEQEDELMILPAGNNAHECIFVKGKTELYFCTADMGDTPVKIPSIDFYGATPPGRTDGQGVGGALRNLQIDPHRPGPLKIPDGAVMAQIRYTANHSFGVGVA